MIHCGCIEILIVVLYLRALFLMIVLLFLFLIILLNQRFWVISIKVFFIGFFRDFELLFNIWNLLFLFLVLFISLRVIIFSFSYISSLYVNNFIFLYFRFVIRIIWLILNTNFYWIIFGWDGLGVVSFLLIIFYINYERVSNGLFTLFQNRFGDLFFILFIVGIINLRININLYITWGIIFLVFGAIVKRAQFPFNAWLLSAIRAPTPISSLVHSSTLVVAGVYILLQFRYCIFTILLCLKYLRFLTLIYSTLGLLLEQDIKKLIAFSTIRHVALIIYLYSYQLYKVVYFHLNIHAIFKSLIFICFGFVILISYHSQDYRLISLSNLNPILKIIFYFSCLCLAGLPFLRAFFSKDFIIEKCIELEIELFFIIRLLFFLRVRIFYRLKLMTCFSYRFSYRVVEKRSLGIWRVILIRVIIIFLINIYLRLVFTLTLEIFSYKISIYLFIFFILLIYLNFKVNWKFLSYRKFRLFKELWVINYFNIDKFIYWNILIILNLLRGVRNFKLIVIINWWVIILIVIIF